MCSNSQGLWYGRSRVQDSSRARFRSGGSTVKRSSPTNRNQLFPNGPLDPRCNAPRWRGFKDRVRRQGKVRHGDEVMDAFGDFACL